MPSINLEKEKILLDFIKLKSVKYNIHVYVLSIDKTKCTDYNKLLAFDKFTHLFKVDTISHGQLSDFVSILYNIDQFFEVNVLRDVHEALLLLLEIFSGVNHIPVPSSNEITDNLLPDFMDSFFYGLYKVQFICSSCQENNIHFETFHHILVLPNVDFSTYFQKETYEENCITCSKCAVQSNQSLCVTLHEKPNVLLIQVNRFSYSCINNRPRKNNQLFGIHEDIKLGLVKYKLLGLITNQGVFTNSGHYVNWVRYSNKWYHCNDHIIKDYPLLTSSKEVYLLFYIKTD